MCGGVMECESGEREGERFARASYRVGVVKDEGRYGCGDRGVQEE
jgi:hypothetical protein